MYKNIAKQEKLQLKDLVSYQEGQVVSKTLVQNEAVSMTRNTHYAEGYSPCGIWGRAFENAACRFLLTCPGNF